MWTAPYRHRVGLNSHCPLMASRHLRSHHYRRYSPRPVALWTLWGPVIPQPHPKSWKGCQTSNLSLPLFAGPDDCDWSESFAGLSMVSSTLSAMLRRARARQRNIVCLRLSRELGRCRQLMSRCWHQTKILVERSQKIEAMLVFKLTKPLK